ncbi:hypothetical protein [Hansschlegelia zhihuaiae]|uniref:hypothetical protein n=1 Tax=Hansschlegelia zhihuaiae TaxID=405005 RepID=UPI0013E8E19B|nr:hypothetical protein [Hansschlegelia zhihuaiae]
MKKHIKLNRSALPVEESLLTPQPMPAAPDTWKPVPCGISREEMRAIVAEMLG